MSRLAHAADWLALRGARARHGLAFLAGGASALGFAPVEAWPLTILGLAVLLWLLPGASRLRSALATGWWFGLGHMLIGLHWIAQAFEFQSEMPAWLGWVAVLLLSALMAVYPAAAVGIAWRIGGQPFARVLALAGAWMLTEWLRGYLFSGFPWNPLGAVWLPLTGVSQAAKLIGGLGLSGLAVLAGGAIALLGEGEPRTRRLSAPVVTGLVAVGIVGLALTRGSPTGSGTRVHLVQANIGQDEKWRPDVAERHLQRYLALSARALAERGPGLVIWPEAAIPNLLEEEPWTRERLARLLGPDDLLLTGAIKAIRDAQGYAVAARNSLFVLDAEGRLRGRYDKAHLVPFGEYLPFRALLEPIGIARLAPGALDFQPGGGPRTLPLPGAPPVGPLICYEIIFPAAVVEPGRRPDWLLNASNDAWFGTSGPYQHLAQARLRAIEEGLPIARATPTGISSLIDPHGRVVASLDHGRAGVVSGEVPAPLPPTPFARLGHAVPIGLALMLLIAAAMARFGDIRDLSRSTHCVRNSK